jgi:hypothetical protein
MSIATADSTATIAARALDQGRGILRLSPTWVPRVYCIPGRRLRLHPDDHYALGTHRGGIDERWFASTTPADNGPDTAPDEGLSRVVTDGDDRLLLRDAMAELGAALIGDRLWQGYGRWPMYSKLFDNLGPLPFHIHHADAHARATGKRGKPEAYWFPPQLNNHGGRFPHTYFGFHPHVTRDQVREALVAFGRGDNRITGLSRAYKLDPGTAWDVPPGVLHAPGSLCTYEPQADSDVYCMYQSVADEVPMPASLLWKDCPPERVGDVEWLLDLIDWDLNRDPDFAANRSMTPRPVGGAASARDEGFESRWICWRSPHFSAQELTVRPGASVVVRDAAAYGCIAMQGRGAFGAWPLETPTLVRHGAETRDEFFVSEQAARAGVRIVNASDVEPLVILKHFGPGNPDLAACADAP